MDKNRVKLTFFDDYWVDFRPGTTRRWYQPELFSVAPTSGYSSIIPDKETGKYRIFYEVTPDALYDGRRLLKLMESEDLKTFTPVLNDEGGDVIFDGDGNLVSSSVLLDEHETDPARKYKYCGMTRTHLRRPGAEGNNITTVLAFSPDGVHWEHHPELVVNQKTSDCLNKLFYNPYFEEYVVCHRAAHVDRRIYLRTSKDLKNWTESRAILHPGAVYNSENVEMQHYSLSANYYDGIFYGLLWQFRTDIKRGDFAKMNGIMDTELVYSYDGRDFLYTTGKPVVERPEAPCTGWAGLGGNDMCESLDGQYYYMLMFSYQYAHGTAENNKRLGKILKEKGIPGGQAIYRIRKDGFCGIESVAAGGKVVTKTMELLKDDLTFNLRADCGSARFGLMDPRGNYLEGFSLDDCIPFEFAQGVEVRPQWKEHELKEVLDQRLRIVVELNGAVLHAMSMTARPSIVHSQVSFANPRGL